MKTVSKKIMPKAQELPNDEILTIKYVWETGMSILKIVGQLNFLITNAV